jgi:uncharacterized protein YegP (UPF0339 family)
MPYELKRADGKFVFNLKAESLEVVLTSNAYKQHHEALAAIEAARTHGASESGFELKRSVTGGVFFVLKSPKEEVLGRSAWYADEHAAWRAMQTARRLCPAADVRDWS